MIRKMLSKRAPILLLLCLTFFYQVSASAHTRSQSFSQWQINEGKLSLSFNILSREITRLAADASIDVRKELSQLLIEHLNGKIKASVDDKICQITTPLHSLPASKGYTRLEAEFNCQIGELLQLEMNGFFDIVPSHLHYARLIRVSGETSEIVLSDATRKQVLNLSNKNESYWQTVKTYINLGVEHILIGMDHLVFLLALLLLCRKLSQALILITGFTLGHSITLSLSVLGWLQPNMTIIEALIGFSIVLVALEKVQKLNNRNMVNYLALALFALVLVKVIANIGLPLISLAGIALLAISYLLLVKNSDEQSTQFLLTTAFGFIHGFGFAEVLREIGLPSAKLGLALLSFNVGVELGQLFALCLMASIVFIFVKLFNAKIQKIATVATVNIVLGLGSYWFLVRSIS